MAGNDYASVGQRSTAVAAPKSRMPKTTPSAGFAKTMAVPKPRPIYAAKLQRQPQFGVVPRSKFSVVNSGLK